MKRTALASLFALALAGAAHADSVVGGGVATITGGGDNLTYSAAPGARTEEPALVGTLSGGGDDESITYAAPAQATRSGGARRG
jgi:hypothetical protein